MKSMLLALCLFTSIAVAQDAATSAPPDIKLPDLDAAAWFDGKMGGTFGEPTVNAFPRNKRIAIAGFRVVFVVHNEAYAISRGSYLPGGVETGTAKAKMEVDLKGVDDQTMQALANAAYERFVAQLKAAGREVVSQEEMKAAWSTFDMAKSPDVTLGNLRGRAFSPAGVPLWWQVGDPWGDVILGQTNMRAFNELSKATNAIAIAPGIVIDFARMQSSGNRSSLMQRGAEVGATLSMSVSNFGTRVVRAEETRYGGIVFKGDDGALKMVKRLDTDAEFADMQKVEESDKGTVMNVLNFLGSKSKKSVHNAVTSNQLYARAADAVLGQATGAFAKLIASHPVK